MSARRRTKIIATLGPASSSLEALQALVKAGVNLFRINFSHIKDDTARKEAAGWVQALREIEVEGGKPLGIFADLQGPKLRVGNLPRGGIDLKPGNIFILDMHEKMGDETRAPLLHPEIFTALANAPNGGAGQLLKLNDGFVTLRVQAVELEGTPRILTEVVASAVNEKFSSFKGVNVPGVRLPISALTEKDRFDLRVALDMGVDYIAQSFVQTVEDVAELKRLIGLDASGLPRAGIIAKIEKPLAVENIAGIAELADALMIARGDLGVEVPAEAVPRIERRLIQAGTIAPIPVILATQVLGSMVRSPQPSRAELSGIEHAVFEGADAVMLSNETAVGEFSIASVEQLHNSLMAAEEDEEYPKRMQVLRAKLVGVRADDAAELPIDWVTDDKAEQSPRLKALVVYTNTGATARRLSRMHPAKPVLCLTPTWRVARKLSLLYGIFPAVAPDCQTDVAIVTQAKMQALAHGFGVQGEKILILWGGFPPGRAGTTNSVTLQTLDMGAI